MKNEILESFQQSYPTSAGIAHLSQGSIYRGKNLHEDFKNKTWFELNLFGITGREFDATQLKILNYIWVSTSYADLRIWPNRISALAGSARTTPILAMVGGIASCDAELFVARPLVSCLSMLYKFQNQLSLGNSLEQLIQNKLDQKQTIFGFGRPITSVDERVPHFIKFLNENQADNGKYFRLAFKIEALLKKKKNIRMNIAALYSAICADLGFNEIEMNLFVSLLVFAGMPPCYLDTINKPEGTILPLKCSDIKYSGTTNQKW